VPQKKVLDKAVTFPVILEHEQVRALKEIAAARTCSVSLVVREAVAKYLSWIQYSETRNPP
jgi:predicted transcriptional regulator